ncbi:MAG: hypothetical protein SGI72_09370 [Planctomycetota bacterium]|nr:hypothetical protein [Planctomycetota bacterium]
MKPNSFLLIALSLVLGWVACWFFMGSIAAEVSHGAGTSLAAKTQDSSTSLSAMNAVLDETGRPTRVSAVSRQPRMAEDLPSSPVAKACNDLEAAVLEPRAYEGEDMDFSAKYASLPPEMLMPAYQMLAKQIGEQGNQILKYRLSNGLDEQKFYSPGDKQEELKGPPDGKPVTWGFSTEYSAGGALVKTVEFSREEYPEFRALQLEYAWVHNRLHELKLCKCNGS